MGKITAAHRKALSAAQFAGPHRTYPIPDRAHAANAKARAAQQVKGGQMSKAMQAKIDAAANKVLKRGR